MSNVQPPNEGSYPEQPGQSDQNELLVELFKKVQDGNQNAFSELYEIIRRPLMAYCLVLTRTVDDAKDLFSLSIAKMYEGRAGFIGGNFEAWIFTIVRNSSRSLYRSSQRRQAEPITDDVADETASSFEEADEAEFVRKAIEKLPQEFRSVIMLKYFGGLSVGEIAIAEGIGQELVKIRLFRARNRLAKYLRHLVEEDL
ncbi:MAG: RNA polymerase sigma factor [Chlorobi bacterium]|nr:MAG: RNA polymerase sigma factor [Bacteroidota bacterium]KXK35729.1 MAG: ECF subfamily RNA polymerase sigma-70 factor [Chlorobi bacterium OLB6]MBL1160229.1 RNA polymerase sigma factor [Chlorobiota bacterium]MBW7853367.1 RNA polymerase sigma factor [Candidatus Kapabacteria bacterium]MCC6330414.1 RNA polymerase sigma factor [Ignavibacteria bacterium]